MRTSGHAWMAENKTQDWSIGRRFVQHQKNSAHHSSVKRTPFKVLFVSATRVGLASPSPPLEVLERLHSEDDLHGLFANPSEDEGLAQDPQPLPASAAPAPTSHPTPAQEPQTSPLTKRLRKITEQRTRAREAQLSQAERMVKRSRIDFKAMEEGDNVTVPIPMMGRGRGDPRNILGVITSRSENDLYAITVKNGILKAKYSRNQFDICPQRLLTLFDVNPKDLVSHRQALKKSTTGGQGFVICDCAESKTCCTNICKCYKASLKLLP
ncbi:uncharacterized protein LOC125031659 [Penaeus chinensis]|uniref:uncharacterized protein LOC125031659 n=1 Tax=Penaeus chinensis TaxID=139456 RepID=UPI001FB5C8C0|nr:uncharacterized protein LOC125031659 [Penaeus chinensis]